MAGILGKKIGMTQIFTEDGTMIPVTVIQSGNCSILQVKTEQSDGYNAIQLGFDEIKDSKVKKPQREKFKKTKVAARKLLKELRVDDPQNYKVGQDITVEQLAPGDFVDIAGVSKGKGFQGGIKRWGWSGGPSGHGSMSHRAPGSIGASAYPSRVIKGHHLPGHMGHQEVTVEGLEVVKIDKDNSIITIKGSVPGPKNNYLVIEKSKKKKPKVSGLAEKKEPEKSEKAKPTKKS
ncbi:50S ribosomal protein L3 [Candidatus Omnitrophota bacterium]